MVSRAIKALKAIKITSELNCRIRLSYACARLIFVPLHWAPPLRMDESIGFHDRYYQTRNPKDAAAKTSRRKKQISRQS
jgi:hypothetical protein